MPEQYCQERERRELYRDGRTVIRAEAEAYAPEDQEEMLPVADVDDDEERALFGEMRRRWYDRDWQYVTLTVTVEFDGAVIGAGTAADAWLLAPGSPLHQAADEAIGRARQWADRHGTAGTREDLGAALRWHEETARTAENRAAAVPGDPLARAERFLPGKEGRHPVREVAP